MKQISPVSIWDKGIIHQAEILNAYGILTQLGKNAQFYYSLLSVNSSGSLGSQVTEGNVTMNDEEYALWGNDDGYAWEFVAGKLNLTIIGDWVNPTIEPTVETVEEYSQDIINGTNPEDTTETPIVEGEV